MIERVRGAVIALILVCMGGAQAQRQAAPPLAADPAYAAMTDGNIVLFRHANAPGVGDPPGFRLGDCGTQRNLDDVGRAQARRIGEQFRAQGIRVGAVLSSQWCRALETAELAFPKQAREDAAFNSFFGDARSQSAEQTRKALARLAQWRGPGVMVVFTHQVNISALTPGSAASAEGVVVRITPDGQRAEVLARWQP